MQSDFHFHRFYGSLPYGSFFICTDTAEDSSTSTFWKPLHSKVSFNSFICHSKSTLARAHREVQLNLETNKSLTTYFDHLFCLLHLHASELFFYLYLWLKIRYISCWAKRTSGEQKLMPLQVWGAGWNTNKCKTLKSPSSTLTSRRKKKKEVFAGLFPKHIRVILATETARSKMLST